MNAPTVTCVMPTANRARFIPDAIDCFLSQSYSDSELLILDNGKEPISLHRPEKYKARYGYEPPVRYLKVSGYRTIGELRNLCCEEARGSVIAHWDDDDWSAPERLTQQVGLLYRLMYERGILVTGYHTFSYWDELTSRAFRYSHGSTTWCGGSSQCYFKEFWRNNPFKHVADGEDTAFSIQAHIQGKLLSTDGSRILVARQHGANTYARSLGNAHFPEIPKEQLPADFLDWVSCRASGEQR